MSVGVLHPAIVQVLAAAAPVDGSAAASASTADDVARAVIRAHVRAVLAKLRDIQVAV